MAHTSPGVELTPRAGDYVEFPTWSTQPHVLPYLVQEEMDCGDIRKVVEIGESCWESFSKEGFQAAGAEAQGQGCPGGDKEAIQQDSVFQVRDGEFLQMG